MLIAGLQKLTLLDYPNQVACTVFTAGCELRCPFCQNPDLVVPELIREAEPLSEDSFFEFLEKRRGKLSGVAITGGEPTLHADLPQFMDRIHQLGFLVKLDTNGMHSVVLEQIIRDGLADYIAMDVKNSPQKYALTTGIAEKAEGELWGRVSKSIALLKQGRIDYEFRTTVVGGLHTVEDIRQIGKGLQGARAWYLQQFLSDRDLINDFGGEEMNLTTPEPDLLRQMCAVAREYVPAAATRGIAD